MSRKSIDIEPIRRVLEDLPRSFSTKDVSEDARVMDAHSELAHHRNYHSFVGKALSDNRGALGIAEVRKGTSRGSRWEKIRSFDERQSPGRTEHGRVENEVSEFGPQYRGDKPFAARMRLHQSWYQAQVLRVPCGTGQMSSSKKALGNMLTRQDGEAGLNFLTSEIADVARARVAQGSGTVEPYRLFHNMLSSQPMCFNLFGPLVRDRDLARRLLTGLVPDEIRSVTAVALEYAPEPTDDYLGDRTAFDAFIEYEATDGRRCVVGIETKLTEPFSQNEYDGEKYRRWMRVQGAPWTFDATSEVQRIEHNQLWRDHLLAMAMHHHPRSTYSKARLAVIYHPMDSECDAVIQGYRRLLKPEDDTLLTWPLSEIVQRWQHIVFGSSHEQWLRDFETRYLDLGRSDPCA